MLRDEILNYVESQFMGPPRGSPHQLDYIKDYMPYQHLVTGMLFPQESIVKLAKKKEKVELTVENRIGGKQLD